MGRGKMQDEAGPYRKGYLAAVRDFRSALIEAGRRDPLVRRLLDYADELVRRLDERPDSGQPPDAFPPVT